MERKFRLYIDESGNPDIASSDNPNHRFLSLTGVAIDLLYIQNTIAPELEELKKTFFNSHPDDPIVLHRKDIMNKRHPFEALKDSSREQAFNDELLRLLAKWEYVVFSVVIDKKEQKDRYAVWKYDPYHYCLMLLIERYTFYLPDVGAIGDVMAESRGGREDIRLKDSFSRLVTGGSDYVDVERFTRVLTSKQLKVKPKSNNIAGLQIADLLAHPSRRDILLENGLIERKAEVFGDRIIELLKSKYYQKNGKIAGYGKKLLP